MAGVGAGFRFSPVLKAPDSTNELIPVVNQDLDTKARAHSTGLAWTPRISCVRVREVEKSAAFSAFLQTFCTQSIYTAGPFAEAVRVPRTPAEHSGLSYARAAKPFR